MSYRKRFRRYRPRGTGRRLHPLAIVGICLGSAVLLALLVGNLLRLWLNDEKLAELQGTQSPPQTDAAPEPEREVPLVQAYPFVLGDKTSDLATGGATAISLSLNTPAGDILYTSPVATHLGLSAQVKAVLRDEMTKIYTDTSVSYISGVFYPQALFAETEELRFAVAAQEAALLHEFASAGGSEVVLLGLSFVEADLPATLSYLKQIKQALGSTPLGISVPFSVAATGRGWELLPTLREQVSFLLLDVREDSTPPDQLLINANYYLVSYQMRLLVSDSQTELLNLCTATLGDLQIVHAFAEEEEE